MKRIIFIMLLIVALVAPSLGQPVPNWNIHGKPNSDWFSSFDTYRNVPLMWMREMEKQISGVVFGKIFYCDANHGDDTNDGESWASATETLADAMGLAHAYIGSGGHATERCIIYYTNDGEAETLTTLARKTDIIGVGSTDADKRARILGDHTIAEDVDYAGCRFFNVEFRGTGAAAEVLHVRTQGGFELHNCKIQGAGSNTHGIHFEECQSFVVNGCEFYGSFSTSALMVAQDTDGIYTSKVTNNRFLGVSAIGIDWNETESYNCWVTDNYIYSVGCTIDDEGDDIFVINNRLITDGDLRTSYDFNIDKAAGNIVTCDEGTITVPETMKMGTDAPRLEKRGAFGMVFYCDNNAGSDTNSGLSWEDAFQTLAVAMAASHTAIGSGGHACDRNTIYYLADWETATLTTLARKTDIIGVGSMNANKRPRILGDHTIAEGIDYAGCRIYNVDFIGTGAAAEILHVKTQGGFEVHGCKFEAAGSNTDGLAFEECQAFVVDDCVFYGAFSNSAIRVDQDTDEIYECMIRNSLINGSLGVGIDWEETASNNCWITDNYIQTVGMPIDEEGDGVFVVNNRMITEIDTDTPANGYDFNGKLASGNFLTGSGTLGQDNVPPSND